MKYSIAIIISLYLIIGLVSAGWFSKSNKRGQKEVPKELKICLLYVFDRSSFETILPEQFVKHLYRLNNAYLTGELEDDGSNRELVSSWVELDQLSGCSEENYEKLGKALERSYDLQNLVEFIKWKRNSLKKKCAQN